MRKFRFEPSLEKLLEKLTKRDKKRYEILMKKVEKILSCEDPNHYKNLRVPLQHLKRVYIDSHFVLTFHYVVSEDSIVFYDFDHHDNIYKKR
ncbi:addiction module toxin RelE [Candidatus Micrarchaeota archaeon]|nr:addiction module toxin RelE [Candidatus Micrarchaeota archaeon]